MAGYDEQLARGLVECPLCASTQVEKAPMAPSIRTTRALSHAIEAEPKTNTESPTTVVSEPSPLAMPEPLKAMLNELKEHIQKTHDYVGDTFAKEVRAMHEGQTQHRPVYGEATPKEIKDLIEDEIPVAPLPALASPKRVKGLQ